MGRDQLRVVLALGSTQTIAWASSYYLPAILADPIARDVGVSSTEVFAAFSISLIASALLGPHIGRTIDVFGGRGVLVLSNVVLAFGLAALGLAHSQAVMWLAWLMIGLGMSLGLYDTAFAALGRIFGTSARPAITGITLIAGFASTVGWPLTAWGLAEYGWRWTCFGWALAHLCVALPVNLLLIPRTERTALEAAHTAKPSVPIDRRMVLLSVVFALAWMVSGAMAAHLPRILEASGSSPAAAVLAGTLIGPAQVAARLAEVGFLGRFHPLLSARLAAVLHPIGVALLALLGGASGAVAGIFAVLHGAGNGVMTIARGTVPLAVFGPANYGYRLGLIGAPARLAQGVAPILFGALIDRFGAGALVVSAAMSLGALVCLLLVHVAPSGD